MPHLSDLTPRQSFRLRTYEIGGAILLAALLLSLYLLCRMGSDLAWTPVDLYKEGGILRDAERVMLSSSGVWLAWVDAKAGAACAADIGHPGRVECLRPAPSVSIRPVEVVEGDLLVLRSSPKRTLPEILERGWHRFMGQAEEMDGFLPQHFASREISTTLERVELNTGRIRSSALGGTVKWDGGDEGPLDFETGRLALSPDRVSLAWWRAKEEVGSTPLSATVTETIEIYSTGPKIGRLHSQQFKTDGDISIRSRLLESIGKPLWLNEDICMVLSFLDSGSFVPFDCREGIVQATVQLAAVQQTMRESDPAVVFDPEGFYLVRAEGASPPGLFFWSRLPDSGHFFLFDTLFHLVRYTRLDTKEYGFSKTAWLERSQSLLVEETGKSRLAALSPRGEKRASYQLPPDWNDGFEILGEDPGGALIGYNRGAFLRGSPGQAGWETVELFR
jgi:hypothetical protein